MTPGHQGNVRVGGINFNRSGLMKIVPGLNVPFSVVMNGSATAALGRKANRFYKELPA